MARFDPFSLPRPKPVQETRTFTDPLQPGAEFTLTLCARVDAVWQTDISVLSSEYAALYVNGTPGDTPDERNPPAPILAPDGTRLAINETITSLIAQLIKMQVPPDGEEAFGIREWLGLALNMPNAFFEIGIWSDQLKEKANTSRPLESAGGTGPSLLPPSDSTTHTPNSASETTPS